MHLKVIIFLSICFVIAANAQCGPCNSTVSGLSASNHYVGAGQTLCVSSTGTITGNIYVGQAGYLCNAGTINSDSVKVDDGGTFNNFKIVNSTFVSILNGNFYNNGIVTIDSFLISQQFANFYNDSIFNGNSLSIKDHLSAINNGTISVTNFKDSIISFTNNGHIHVNHNLNNISSSNFTNNGTIYVGNDFLNSDASFFTCNNYMVIQHDFSNTSAATFEANCMLTVNHDWYNYGFVYGSVSMCGGFNVIGVTFSNSNLGIGGRYLDICDAGNPPAGIDYPWGWIESNTTYCSCSNICANILTDIKKPHKDNMMITMIYPNPTSNTLLIKFNNKENENLTVEVKDMLGKIILSKTPQVLVGENETDINVSGLTQGTYILTITNSHQLQAKRLFSIVK